MVRLLVVVVILSFALLRFMPDLLDNAADSGPGRGVQAARELAEGTVPVFRGRLEAGAGCAELISIRDTYDPDSKEVARMNDELLGIGCDNLTSTRTR